MDQLERQYRLIEVAQLTGYSVHSLRRKITQRQLGYRRTGRIITIPETEIHKLLGKFVPSK